MAKYAVQAVPEKFSVKGFSVRWQAGDMDAPGCSIEKEIYQSPAFLEAVEREGSFYMAFLKNGAKLLAVCARLAKEPHPFLLVCEAAVWYDGVWIVGIDPEKDCCFSIYP